MTRKTIENFINEIFSKLPKKNYPTNKTGVKHNDDIRSLDLLDIKVCGPENNRGYRYVLVVFDNFSKFGWTVSIKNKLAIIIIDSFENVFKTSKKPSLKESDDGQEFVNKIFTDLLNKSMLKDKVAILS